MVALFLIAGVAQSKFREFEAFFVQPKITHHAGYKKAPRY